MPPESEFRYDVFISYSHKDAQWVQESLLPQLELAGNKVCIDFRDFQVGASSVSEMERAVLQSRRTLIVLSPAYIASEWGQFENTLAQTLDPAARQRRVLPLLLEPCEIPLRIRALTYLDWTTPRTTEFKMEKLLAAVRS